MPKGALLEGRPGTGKTYLAKCFAGQIIRTIKETRKKAGEDPKDIAFIALSAAQILSEKDPVAVVKLLFSEASRYDAAVIFLDELDAIGRDRNSGNTNIGLLTQLMVELDGFGNRDSIFVLAATNDPDRLDAALKREGRFDRSFVIDLPLMFLAMAFVTIPALIRGKLSRIKGIVLQVLYAAYVTFQFAF